MGKTKLEREGGLVPIAETLHGKVVVRKEFVSLNVNNP